MYGLFTTWGAARQIAGSCGERQIPEVDVAIAQGNGGELASEAILVLGSEATL